MIFALAWVLSAGEDVPRVLSAQEAPRAEPVPAEPAALAAICLNRPEVEIRAGFVAFSSDFESDPMASASVLVRWALPWMSRELLGFCEDHLGVFLEGTVSRMERELEPASRDSKGEVFFATAGLDATLIHGEDADARLQFGAQIGRFGDVEGVEDGVAGLIGLRAAVRLIGSVRIAVSPQVAFGEDGARVYFAHLGLRFDF